MLNKNKYDMIQDAADRLHYLTDHLPGILMTISEEAFSAKPFPDKWSKKQVLGHLIDSATNNHHRLVRGQFELNAQTGYDQEKWNACSFYQEIDSRQIIAFWTVYNKQLVEIIKRLPAASLNAQVKVGNQLCSLSFLITDYVQHLEHHLKQITDY